MSPGAAGEAQPGVQEAAGKLARALRRCRSRCRSDRCRSLRVRHSKQPDPPGRVSKRPWSEGQSHLWRLREDIVEPERRRKVRAQAASAKHEHFYCCTLDSTGFPGGPHGRLGAAAPLREGHAPSERPALRTPFLRFRSGQFRTSFTLSPIYTASCRRACFCKTRLPGVRRQLWLPYARIRRSWRGSFRRPH